MKTVKFDEPIGDGWGIVREVDSNGVVVYVHFVFYVISPWRKPFKTNFGRNEVIAKGKHWVRFQWASALAKQWNSRWKRIEVFSGCYPILGEQNAQISR